MDVKKGLTMRHVAMVTSLVVLLVVGILSILGIPFNNNEQPDLFTDNTMMVNKNHGFNIMSDRNFNDDFFNKTVDNVDDGFFVEDYDMYHNHCNTVK